MRGLLLIQIGISMYQLYCNRQSILFFFLQTVDITVFLCYNLNSKA